MLNGVSSKLSQSRFFCYRVYINVIYVVVFAVSAVNITDACLPLCVLQVGELIAVAVVIIIVIDEQQTKAAQHWNVDLEFEC